MKKSIQLTTTLRTRISEQDVHYAGGLATSGIASGARVLELFGDAATELLIRLDGDEGLFRAYQSVEFLSPVMAGDFLEVSATLVSVGKTSRTLDFVAYKVITSAQNKKKPSKALVLKTSILVARARGTCVVK